MLIDIEGEALKLLRDHGFDPTEPPDPLVLASAVVGAANVITTRGMFAPAMYRPATDTIELRPGLSNYRRRWLVVHELAERTLHRACWSGETVERYADALGGAILVPGPALRAALRVTGRRLDLLSEWFSVSQSIVTLRLADVTRSPLALVSPSWVKVRGDDFAWPDERELRRVAREGHAALERVELTDSRRRVALWAA